jgi:phage terminase large subunit
MSKTSPSIEFKPTPVFIANQRAYQSGYGVICNQGGSRSGKTYSITQLLIILALSEQNLRTSIVSHSLPHIKRGAYRDFRTIMDGWGIWDDAQFRYTDFVYTFPNGSYIELFGLEDEGKARGPGRDILFINEANLIAKPLYDQLLMRTTRCTFMDWNPADFSSWVYDVADHPDNKLIHSTYENNRSNLSAQQIKAIESYRDLPDDFWWKVYGLGQRGASKEIIYTAWKPFSEDPPGDVVYGLDFGYTNPSALVKITHYDGSIYAREVIYQSNLTTDELIRLVKQNTPSGAIVYCDAAEPKSIEMLFRAGINAKPADKDVWAGIVFVKSKPLYINGPNITAEIQSYKWQKDKNDNVTETPVKANDHALDAMRYAVFTHLAGKRVEFAAAKY